ncbi:MAG: hypothetical protein A3K77_05620, partial [Euryarchaeota archaeon RBG_13_31_8]
IVVNAIQKKKPEWKIVYTYIDGTSYQGIYLDDTGKSMKGSPILFLESVKEIKPRFKVNCYFIEKETEKLKTLRDNIYAQNLQDVAQIEYICGLYEKEIPTILMEEKKSFGLIYIDPNGIFADNDIEKICHMENIGRMDILINCNVTGIKRIKNVEKIREVYKKDLKTRLKKIPKEVWWISPPHISDDPWGWCFLYGLNSECLKPTGFFPIDSPEGKSLLDKANYTKEEYKNNFPKQPALEDF